MNEIEFILYVSNQENSKKFYEKILNLTPTLDVPGMTEFQLSDSCKLGLMPENGIANIISPKMPHPAKGAGIPRCELYLRTENIFDKFRLAIEAGAIEISAIEKRDWGDEVGYVADPDGHVIAFAKKAG